MKYTKILASLDRQQTNYLLKQINKIIKEYESDIDCQNNCLWRIASQINLFEDLDTTGKLTPHQRDETFEFLISFVAWFSLAKWERKNSDQENSIELNPLKKDFLAIDR